MVSPRPRVPVTSTTSSTRSGGNALVSTPIEIRRQHLQYHHEPQNGHDITEDLKARPLGSLVMARWSGICRELSYEACDVPPVCANRPLVTGHGSGHDLRALLEKPTPRLVTWRSSASSEAAPRMHM